MPKIIDHDQYRKELLLKAFDLFAERGYGSLTMRQLAQGLGVSTGTLYHYFQSKEDLFLKLMAELAQQDFREVEMTMAAAGETLEERVEAIFRWVESREELFLKQVLLSISFYQEQHNSQELVNGSQLLSTLNEGYRNLSKQYLGIEDPDLIQMLDALLGGLVLSRVFCLEKVSFQRQGQLLGKMLRAYVERHCRDRASQLN
ncbi:TetR/AcrR family transcriptional regulator [Synechococcus sp. Nb3U1]|uniref:TetR/AcrR family transcriptional regulator n=1 Tax=Synechococcus sp. Nb3U1 TaxID=1914529 RepID=UPI001F39C8C8|nr:TetR/AcrR family transcriptional regulator [Synechococcus sp. Nb3U1]MCF2970707.1 TetR/AcrR family transcriptional regulator [Synechococcus sp. Nb3U1]